MPFGYLASLVGRGRRAAPGEGALCAFGVRGVGLSGRFSRVSEPLTTRSEPGEPARAREKPRIRVPTAQSAPELCKNVVPQKIRGRRESRVPNAPAASRANSKKHTSKSPQVHRSCPAFPARWFTAYTRSPRCPGFLATVAGGIDSANLIPAPLDQDHTISPYALGVARLATPTRPPHPIPR